MRLDDQLALGIRKAPLRTHLHRRIAVVGCDHCRTVIGGTDLLAVVIHEEVLISGTDRNTVKHGAVAVGVHQNLIIGKIRDVFQLAVYQGPLIALFHRRYTIGKGAGVVKLKHLLMKFRVDVAVLAVPLSRSQTVAKGTQILIGIVAYQLLVALDVDIVVRSLQTAGDHAGILVIGPQVLIGTLDLSGPVLGGHPVPALLGHRHIVAVRLDVPVPYRLVGGVLLDARGRQLLGKRLNILVVLDLSGALYHLHGLAVIRLLHVIICFFQIGLRILGSQLNGLVAARKKALIVPHLIVHIRQLHGDIVAAAIQLQSLFVALQRIDVDALLLVPLPLLQIFSICTAAIDLIFQKPQPRQCRECEQADQYQLCISLLHPPLSSYQHKRIFYRHSGERKGRHGDRVPQLDLFHQQQNDPDNG